MYPGSVNNPIRATATVAARMGPGHRTIAVPTRRHRRVVTCRFGSNSPKRLPAAMQAGTKVSATATATKMPTAPGIPSGLK
ncbi:Uncharacterised protein [Mycobacteroides abscessus subsp. abscessus]|nr:Uncharacterised protein [Mycobacteroides abscessus subsp. abscessus]SKV60179.1 Uncharacterised protein [Mycobacteroides abscessus subsp. abscessus]